MPPRRAPSSIAAAGAAFLGWLFAVLLGYIDVRPLAWALLGGLLMAHALAALSGHRRVIDTMSAVGFTFAFVLLEWPILTIAYVFVRYWITGQGIGD